MLIRSIGSICTAMFRRIDAPRTCFGTASCHPTASAAGVEGRGDMTRNTARRHQHGIETDIADAIIGVSRQPRLGGGDAQALSSRSRALTSTNTSRLRRRAMMSISPTGLFQRRARMRKPLAMRNAAARLSAEIPVRNAIWRSGRGTWIGRARGRSSATVALLGECKRALVDAAAGFSGDGGDFGDRLLDRKTLERLTQQRVEIGRWQFGWPIGRRHDDRDLAPRLVGLRSLARERTEIAAPDLLVELGELAADCGLARTKLRGEVGERRRDARPALEQNERRGNALELVDARAA